MLFIIMVLVIVLTCIAFIRDNTGNKKMFIFNLVVKLYGSYNFIKFM